MAKLREQRGLKTKRTKARIETENSRYHLMVEDSPAYICRFRPDGTLIFVNPSFSNFFGIPKKQLIGTSFLKMFPESEQPGLQHKLKALAPDSPTMVCDHAIPGKDGKNAWHKATVRAFFDDQGNPTEYQCIALDLTANKAAHEKIASLEKKLEKLQVLHNGTTVGLTLTHELKSVFTLIKGYAELGISDLGSEKDRQFNLTKIMGAAIRGIELIEGKKDF
jgi:PAS domain S-box-containing protein